MNIVCTACHDPHGPVPGTIQQLLKPVNELATGCPAELTTAEHAPKAPVGATCAICYMPGGSHPFGRPTRK